MPSTSAARCDSSASCSAAIAASSTSRCVRSVCTRARDRSIPSSSWTARRSASAAAASSSRRASRSALAASRVSRTTTRASSDSSARVTGVVERGARGGEGVATQAPRAAAAEAVTAIGDDRERRLAQHEIEGPRPVAVGEDRAVEQPLDRGREPRHRAAHAIGEQAGARHAGRRRARTGGVGHDQQRAGVAVGEPLERLARRDRTVDHDRAHRVTEHRVHRGLDPGVDVEVVDQRADDTGHVVERGDGGVVTAGVERRGQRLRACVPPRRVGVGGAQGVVGGAAGVRGARDRVARGLDRGAERGQRLADARVRGGERRRARRRARRRGPRPVRAAAARVSSASMRASASRRVSRSRRAMRRSSALRAGTALSANARCAAARS